MMQVAVIQPDIYEIMIVITYELVIAIGICDWLSENPPLTYIQFFEFDIF